MGGAGETVKVEFLDILLWNLLVRIPAVSLASFVSVRVV